MIIRSSLLIAALAASAAALGTTATALRAADQGVVIVEERPPTFVEEGSLFNGTVVVAPADVNDYVFINGGWYYYHPGLKTWVHVDHDKDWHPPHNGHIFRKWSEHPMYHGK